MTEAEYTNRLINEKSPYLLQHAHNPVDWYPWGSEAIEASNRLDKPIFLSIGYSTCHWCHVMEKESFENPEIAAALNKNFINIKVDREELPGVDSLYMELAQSMINGAPGWPLNVILTPRLHPFFAVTYLPPHHSHDLMGLLELIERIGETWNNEEEREKLETQSNYIIQLFAKTAHNKGSVILDKEEMIDGTEFLFKMTDSVYGGMKGEPKFPLPYYMNYLLNYSATMKDSRALFIVDRTLEMMHRGGIYDHLGGGFSRYSVDERWFLPHFEKMLYDNAMLAKAYFAGWQATKKPLYRQVSEEICNYLLRDMKYENAGFFAAEDADSENHEGYFYTWPYDQVQELLGNNASFFCEFFSITKLGNFEGRNILTMTTSLEEFARHKGLDPKELGNLFRLQKEILWKEREKRVHPSKDHKIIASWNGLAIDALASAADVEDNNHYLQAAQDSARFILTQFVRDNRLKRRWCDGEVAHEGGLEDYAFLIKGLISLFETDGNSEWLKKAIELAEITDSLFKSPEGAYFQTSEEDHTIILRKCHFSDGAEPSGNSIHCENLLKLYDLTGEEDYLSSAEDILKTAQKYINHYPAGYIYHLMNVNRYHNTHRPSIVIALNEQEDYRKELFELLHHHYIPHKTVIWRKANDKALFELLPGVKEQEPIAGKTTLYICHLGICKKPLTEFTEMKNAILE